MEVWKNINGFPNYEASSLGNIRSKLTGTIMKFCKNKQDDTGYYQISLTMGVGVRFTRKVHTLVCIAFHGAPPTELHTVNHKDGNKLNNIPENLEWMTRKQQAIHSYNNLNNIEKRPRGKGNHWRATYSDDEIRLIRKLHKEGLGYHRIRNALGNKTSWVAIQMIVTKKTYYHVSD